MWIIQRVTECELSKNSDGRWHGRFDVWANAWPCEEFLDFYLDSTLLPTFSTLHLHPSNRHTDTRFQFHYISSHLIGQSARRDFHMHLFYWSAKIAESTIYSKHTSEMCSTRAQMYARREKKPAQKIQSLAVRRHSAGTLLRVFGLSHAGIYIPIFLCASQFVCVFFSLVRFSHSFCTIIVFRSKTNVSEEIPSVYVWIERSRVGCDGFCGIFSILPSAAAEQFLPATTERCAYVSGYRVLPWLFAFLRLG